MGFSCFGYWSSCRLAMFLSNREERIGNKVRWFERFSFFTYHNCRLLRTIFVIIIWRWDRFIAAFALRLISWHLIMMVGSYAKFAGWRSQCVRLLVSFLFQSGQQNKLYVSKNPWVEDSSGKGWLQNIHGGELRVVWRIDFLSVDFARFHFGLLLLLFI